MNSLKEIHDRINFKDFLFPEGYGWTRIQERRKTGARDSEESLAPV